MTTTIETPYARKLIVSRPTGWGDTNLAVKDTDLGTTVCTSLNTDETVDLAKALLNAEGKEVLILEDLPEVTEQYGYLEAGSGPITVSRNVSADPAAVLKTITNLTAVHRELVKRQEAEKAKAEEAKKAEEALQARRDKLADELAPRLQGLGKNWYSNVSTPLQKAIDQIIELEDAAKPKIPLF